MRPNTPFSCARRQRGVALITVILILLVLTVLGMAATIMMTQEDRLSARQQMQKEAFYAAEAGLRHGERVFSNLPAFTNEILTERLQPPAALGALPECPATNPRIPQHPAATRNPAMWDTRHLGTYHFDDNSFLVNREIDLRPLSGRSGNRRAYYSLYVRNNPEDMGNLQTPPVNVPPDARLRLVAVGFVTDGNGVVGGIANVLAVRMIEEELSWERTPGGETVQDIQDAGGTGSGSYTVPRTPTPEPGETPVPSP